MAPTTSTPRPTLIAKFQSNDDDKDDQTVDQRFLLTKHRCLIHLSPSSIDFIVLVPLVSILISSFSRTKGIA